MEDAGLTSDALFLFLVEGLGQVPVKTTLAGSQAHLPLAWIVLVPKSKKGRDSRKYAHERFHEDTLLAAYDFCDGAARAADVVGAPPGIDGAASLWPAGAASPGEKKHRWRGDCGACSVRECASAPQEFERRAAALLVGSGGFRGEFSFPARYHNTGDTIAQNSHGGAAHIHELIDREEKKKRLHRQVKRSRGTENDQ